MLFSKNYSCCLVKQYALRRNFAIFAHLRLVQVVPQALAMGMMGQLSSLTLALRHLCLRKYVITSFSKLKRECKLLPRLNNQVK